jgi:maltose O-acetyltransferase
LRVGINPRFVLFHACAWLLPNYVLCGVRAWLYRAGGCDIANSVALQGPLTLLGGGPAAHHLHVGEGSIVAPMVVFGLDADISIHRRVAIGPGAAFHTATHAIGFGSRRMQLPSAGHGITIEDGVWIGANSVILPGVTVGRGSVVAAGTVLTDNVPPNVVTSGNPATVGEALPFGHR